MTKKKTSDPPLKYGKEIPPDWSTELLAGFKDKPPWGWRRLPKKVKRSQLHPGFGWSGLIEEDEEESE